MEENGESGYRIGEVDDRLTNLPEVLLFEILSKLPTKDVVKCSVLSSRWRNLWRYVPVLDLDLEFVRDVANRNKIDEDFNALVSFVDEFLGFSSESCIHKFRLNANWPEEAQLDVTHFTRWINTVVERKVKHLHVLDNIPNVWEIPTTVYTCESLVSLNLCGVCLPNLLECVSLPSVKAIVLDRILFVGEGWSLEMLISGCPVLESLTINVDNYYYPAKPFRVCSQSLLSFTYVANDNKGIWFQKLEAVIDAPRLERLRLSNLQIATFIVKNPGSLVQADINIFDANDLPKRDSIRNFLDWISCVKDMNISSSTLQVIYDFSRCEPLPLFHNLSFLRVEFSHTTWEILPIFLESCPNLKSLSLGFNESSVELGVSVVLGPRRFLTSLEYVKIVKPMAVEATKTKLKLVSYFLENSTILKKLTLCLGNFREKERSVIIKKLSTIPRLSSSCQVYVLQWLSLSPN